MGRPTSQLGQYVCPVMDLIIPDFWELAIAATSSVPIGEDIMTKTIAALYQERDEVCCSATGMLNEIDGPLQSFGGWRHG